MLKTKWAICGCCEGNGRVENPAFSNGFTSEEWADMCSDYDDGDDTSAADRYMAGAYDVVCSECRGTGKIKVPDVQAMTFGEKRQHILNMREQQAEARARREIAAEYAAERRMGC